MQRNESRIGQLFITGFPGERPPESLLTFVAEEQIGGIILFRESCRTHELARENIEAIKSRCGPSIPLIAIDQEGGRICRLHGAPAQYRAAAEYGRQNNLDRFREEYTRSAVFMKSLGVNANMAPVCDISLNPSNTCLKDRCFGSTSDIVARFVAESVRISREAGLLSCLKHFPGLGAAAIDPHEETAVAEYDELIWQQQEMIPFAAGVSAGANMVMTTHIKVPPIDDEIATGSAKIVSMIREGLSFDGVVVTDDLTMAGARPLGHIGERTAAALATGHDLLLFGKDFEAAIEAYDFLVDAIQRGELPPRRVEQALGRVAGLKFKLDTPVLR